MKSPSQQQLPALVALGLCAQLCGGAELFVSPTGDDTAAGTQAAPFRTVQRAQTAARALIKDMHSDVAIHLAPGDYRIERTLAFSEADSGRNGFRVIWRSAAGPGQARLLGSKVLTGWQPYRDGIWKIDLPPKTIFHTLYENGRRVHKARFPDLEVIPEMPTALGRYLVSVTGSPKQTDKTKERQKGPGWLAFRPEDVPPVSTVTKMRIHIYAGGKCDWVREIQSVVSTDSQSNRLTLAATPMFGIGTGARFFLEDELGFLNKPGEFFVDEKAHTLYYKPLGKGHPDTLGIAYPVVSRMLQLQGKSRDECVERLRFEGLALEETDCAPPLALWAYDGKRDGALVWMSNTARVEIRNCHLKNGGRSGVMLIGHNTENLVTGCWIEHMGLNGVSLCNKFTAPDKKSPTADRCESNRVHNTHISHVGELHTYAECVTIFNVSHNEVDHCQLDNSVRYALTLRGNTGEQYGPPVSTPFPPTAGNRFHHVRIERCGQDGGDMGALHCANLNNPGGGSTNTFEQITVVDTRAVPSVKDIAPDGIFLDWPKMSMDQTFRHVQIARSQGKQLRSHKPENGDSARTENVSWKPGFRADLMDYANIGLTADFPAAYGGHPAPAPVPEDLPPATTAVNYARPFEPPTRPAFLPLPPGAVEPEGWLRDWCLAARDGFTGHMDEVHPEFQRAWAADHKMTGERLNWPKGAWPYEGGGYWFDGLVRLGYALHDDALIQQAQRRFDIVVNNMNTNSILFLWWLNKNNPDDLKAVSSGDYWSIWASGLLGRAMAAYYAGSGDPRVLQALATAYGGNRAWVGWGMSNPWPAFDTYTWTGNQNIAATLTKLFAEDGGGLIEGDRSWLRYRQPPNAKPGAEKNDHVVHFLESTTPWAVGYLWTGRRGFLDATLAWHDLLERDAMQPSGVPVADEFYGPTGAFRGTETCDVAGYLWSQIALLTVSGQGRMADRAERSFFNAGPATVARDFKTHVYFQSPNRIVDQSPPYPHGPKASGNSYKATHYPLCCTAALNRILPNYVMHMWMATYDNGLAATHYGPCKVTALAANRVPVELVCRTDYPFNEVIVVDIKPARAATFPLSFRIPGWCRQPELSVNGTAINAAPDANGFVRIERLWKADDTIRLRFPMAVSVLTGRDNNAQGAPFASVSYGPLLFALPIPDTRDPNTPDPAAKWKYALDALAPDIVVERQAMPDKWNWPLAAPLKLRVKATPIAWSPEPAAPRLPAAPCAKLEASENITLVPYGCTKFRIAMFPVTADGNR